MEEGDLCSVRSGEGTYSVAKILKLEGGVTHVRVYAETYEERPPAGLEYSSGRRVGARRGMDPAPVVREGPRRKNAGGEAALGAPPRARPWPQARGGPIGT